MPPMPPTPKPSARAQRETKLIAFPLSSIRNYEIAIGQIEFRDDGLEMAIASINRYGDET
jgi:hypothetical protein